MKRMALRDYSVDLCKVFCMLGICFLHAAGAACHHPIQWLANLFYCCVPCFVFVTGWFGIDFSIRKVLGLYAQAAYATVIAYLCLNCEGEQFTWIESVRMFRSYLFLNAYVLLMFMAPALNALVDSADNAVGGSKALYLVIAIPFLWGFAKSIPVLGSFVPEGVGSYSGWMMMGVYCVGRILRRSSFETWVKENVKMALLLLLLSIIMCIIGIKEYNSPFSLVLAIAIFYSFKQIQVPLLITRILVWIVPSLFMIYLIHSRADFGLMIMDRMEDCLSSKGVPLLFAEVIVAVMAFIVGLVLDIPRRILYVCVRKMVCQK